MKIIEVAFSGTVGTRSMGPVSTDICELSNRFAERGHEVIITDLAGNVPRELLHRSIRLLELPGIPESRAEWQIQNRVHRFVRRWSNCYRYVRELTSHLDLAGADVVHFHSPVPAFLAQRLYGIKTFYTAHTALWSLNQASTAKPVKATKPLALSGRLHDWVERDMIRRSSLTIGLGDYLAAAVPRAEVVTIPNGLDSASWSQVDRGSARAALGIGAQDFVVLFTGRIHPVKGVDILLDAVKRLAPAMPDLKVLLIGPLSGAFDSRDDHVHPYARDMMALAHGLPVTFLGFINNRDAEFRQYLAAADVFVLPSRAEPQGLVVLEALAMGTPVIGSATGGIPDMVSPDVGYLFPPEDAASLAARIKEAHDHPRDLESMRKVARARVESQFSWDSATDRYLAEFERVVRARGPNVTPDDDAIANEIAR